MKHIVTEIIVRVLLYCALIALILINAYHYLLPIMVQNWYSIFQENDRRVQEHVTAFLKQRAQQTEQLDQELSAIIQCEWDSTENREEIVSELRFDISFFGPTA